MAAPDSNYHACECYGHDNSLPDYRLEVSIPRTLQGHYAKNGGCPCRAKTHGSGSANAGCICRMPAATLEKKTYRATEGPHAVHVAGADGGTGADPQFPNSRNYGGTVAQRGATTMANTALPRSAVAARRNESRTADRLQNRKNFLAAVLRDEMLARMDAEERRGALEQATGLMGSNHVDDYEATVGPVDSSKPFDATGTRRGLPTVAEQYDEVVDELRYVAGRPVGSKLNINRLYYLLEEEDRINNLRFQDKMATRSQKLS